MPNKLTIYVQDVPTDDPNVKQTVSKIVLHTNDLVTFSNMGSANALVTFVGNGPLCKGGQSFNPIPLAIGQEEKNLLVCVASGEFKYTAEVTGAQPEDPIIFVERALVQPPDEPVEPKKNPIIFPEDVVPILLGVVIGFLIGIWVGRRRVARPSL